MKNFGDRLTFLRPYLRIKISWRTFLSNLCIGVAIALLVYFVKQTGLIEHLLNRFLFLLLSAIGNVLHYGELNVFTVQGIALDLATVIASVICWTVFKTLTGRIIPNLLIFSLLLPLTVVLMDEKQILLCGAPIVAGIMLAIIIEAIADHYRKRFRKRIAEEKQGAEFSVICHLAHNVKPGLQMVRSPLLSIRDLLERKGMLDTELSRRMDGSVETMGDALNNAVTTLRQINDIIDNTRLLVTHEINREMFREVELKEFLLHEVLPPYAGRFTAIVEGGPIWISLHTESFIEAVNNLLRNAMVHAFNGDSADNRVRFTLRQTRKHVIIDYSNNGTPFPANLEAADFLSFGKKGADSPGDGLGGAWIAKVIAAHGGHFEIIRDDLPVHFRITLSNKENR